MKQVLIGLGSKAQIGKDYAAIQLKKELAKSMPLEITVERIAFADALKKDLTYLFKQNGLNLDELLAVPELKEKVRPLLVTYGQIMRKFKPDVWIDRAFDGRLFPPHHVTIVTDVRFPNEVAKIKEMGGYYVEIISDRPPANETEALYSPLMEGLADFKVKNNFDGEYVKDMVNLVHSLLFPHEPPTD